MWIITMDVILKVLRNFLIILIFLIFRDVARILRRIVLSSTSALCCTALTVIAMANMLKTVAVRVADNHQISTSDHVATEGKAIPSHGTRHDNSFSGDNESRQSDASCEFVESRKAACNIYNSSTKS